MDRRFVYPLELTRADLIGVMAALRVLPTLPPEVCERAQRGRAAILIWLGDVAASFELDRDGTVSLFDAIALFAKRNELPPRAIWLVTGTVSALDDHAQWNHARDLSRLETFRVHAMTIFPSFAQATHRANRCGWDVACRPDDVDGAVALSKRPVLADEFRRRYRSRAELEDERASGEIRDKRILCRLGGHELHRQIVISYLHGWGLLEDALASFDAAPADLNDTCAFAVPGGAVLQDRLRRSWLDLQPRLPLAIVGAAPQRRCYVALASEAAFNGFPSVDADMMAAILDWQPFVRLGSADALRYLRALGFRSFGRLIDERYDGNDTDANRIQRLLDVLSAVVKGPRAGLRDLYFEFLPELEHNHAHLIEGRHQLHATLRELNAVLAAS